MSTRIVTLFGEEIVPEVPKPAAKPRSKKKGRADGEDADAEDDTDNDSIAGDAEDVKTPSVAEPDAGALHDFAMVAAIASDVPPVAMVDPTDDTTFAAIDNVVVPDDPYAYDDMVQEYASVAAMASIELLVSVPQEEPTVLQDDSTATRTDEVSDSREQADTLAVDDTGITVHTSPRHSFVAVAQGHNPSHTGAPLVTATDRRALLAGIRGNSGSKAVEVPEPVPPPKAKKTATRSRALPADAEQDSETPNVIPADWKGEKNYYAIGEVATLFGVKTSHIRFWTNEFALKVRTTRKGDRLYTPDQIRELRAIYHLVKERGFTLAGAKAKLKAPKSMEVTTVDLKTSLTALRNKLQILRDRL
jgi:DNA-binding transcriptional MerR regulator